MYAVIDMETTGLSPAHHHRVVEIAIVLVDEAGRQVDEWDTLVNPQRDVGASDIHGLTAADVYAAPLFADVAGEVVALLSGRVPVAHNLSFDARFLAAEFHRLNVAVPLNSATGLCTMRMASRYLPTVPRNLISCCEAVGWSIQSAHAALDDARAAAQLLSHYITVDSDFLNSWSDVISAAWHAKWPTLKSAAPARISRRQAAAAPQEHFLGRLALRTPRSDIHPEADSYLSLLDKVLLDRRLSRHEEDELVAAAEMLGLAREDVIRLHRVYMAALGKLAQEDGIVNAAEIDDLRLVAAVLGLSDGDVAAALAGELDAGGIACQVGLLSIKPGDTVVFTGEASGIERASLEVQARKFGLRVAGSVSGKTRLLVAADLDSISGKATKARQLGIPIVDYGTYLRMMEDVS